MPDEGLAASLLETANSLAKCADAGEEPCQAHIRRAISTCYFAAFHALARTAANSLVGADPAVRPRKAWVEVYRGLSHGACSKACTDAAHIDFPEGILNFANTFVQLQNIRHKADYDPTWRPTVKDAEGNIKNAEMCLNALAGAEARDLLAFSTYVLITSKGAQSARIDFKKQN